MINKLALKTAEKFVSNYNTLYDKIEVYQYGFFVLFSNILFLIITSLIGVILNVFLQSIIFYFTFFYIIFYHPLFNYFIYNCKGMISNALVL